MTDRHGPYHSPSERLMKRHKVGEDEVPMLLTQEPASPDDERPVIEPRLIQERFWAKMNQQIERSAADIICSEAPVDAIFQSGDTDAMFDDIPLEDLEEALAIGEAQVENKNRNTEQDRQDLVMNDVNNQNDGKAQDDNTGIINAGNDHGDYNNNDDDDDDMFGDDLPMEFLDQISNTQNESVPSPDNGSKYIRYIVANVGRQIYTDEHGFQKHEKILHLLDDKDNMPSNVRLRDEWVQINVSAGDIVHIPASRDDVTETNKIIDSNHGYIILHPDYLISCTAVAESFFCLRKSILQQKIKSLNDYSEALVHGDIIHRVIQRAMQTQDFSIESLKKEMWNIIKQSLDQLFAIEQDEETAMNILQHVIGSIKTFADTFIGSKPKPHAKPANDLGPDVAPVLGCTSVAVSRVLDVEEHLWSPTYGLKGMIDASVEIKLAPNRETFTIPLELKTGRTNRFISHRAQTILYTLLMSDRYDIGVVAGALYYSKVNSFYLVPAVRNDLKGLLIARNRLASALQNRENLPPMLKNLHSCQHCAMNDACMLFHKAVEGGNAASSGLGGWFNTKTQHINEATAVFFRNWQSLIDKEEDDIDYIRRDIWRQDGSLREKSGRCLHNMKLVSTENTYLYRFQRSDEGPITSQLVTGDPIIISSTRGHINLGMGFVHHQDTRSITVSLTGPLRRAPKRAPEFDIENHQVFSATAEKDLLYRIDKDELAGGMALMRRNLVTLVTRPEDGGDEKRRKLIVDLKKPAFANTLSIPDGALDKLNPAQRNAMEKVFSAQDYTLILGMPGTGKTMTTAAIICALVKQNKSVLLTAYTHSALDNVLSKVYESGIDVLRLGNSDRVMPSLRQCVPSNNVNLNSVAAIEQFYDSKKVVGTTCLGITHNLFQKRRFDYCIVDEASQITLPACVGPLRYADVFVLVGDQYQLPPVVRDDEARRSGFSKSLFSLLAEAHPESVAYLEYQYRMNKDIMSLSNTLVYDSKLKCGNHAVAKRQLKLPNIREGLEFVHGDGTHNDWRSRCWIHDVIDPSRKVVFIDTDRIPAREERVMDAVQNDTEATLLCQVADALLACGLEQKELAVISVYRSQLRLISQYLRNRPEVEVATIDKYQGRDKECVLISLVRSNPHAYTGDLLRDWRRINVALTRAKSKVVLIGSKSTLETSAMFQSFLRLIQSKKWIYELHPDAHKEHVIRQLLTPPQPERTTKVFSSSTQAMLKNRPILKDVYNSM